MVPKFVRQMLNSTTSLARIQVCMLEIPWWWQENVCFHGQWVIRCEQFLWTRSSQSICSQRSTIDYRLCLAHEDSKPFVICWSELCRSAHRKAQMEWIPNTTHMTGWRRIHLELKPIATSVKKKVMNSGFIHFCYSDLAPTKLVPWSDWMSLVGPQQLRNRCKASINASVVRTLAALRCIAHKAKKANSTHIFSALLNPL